LLPSGVPVPESLVAVFLESLVAVFPESLVAVFPESLVAVFPESLAAVFLESLAAVFLESLAAVFLESLAAASREGPVDFSRLDDRRLLFPIAGFPLWPKPLPLALILHFAEIVPFSSSSPYTLPQP
jgi:hypothetical protein